jgi:hypothetical protein
MPSLTWATTGLALPLPSRTAAWTLGSLLPLDPSAREGFYLCLFSGSSLPFLDPGLSLIINSSPCLVRLLLFILFLGGRVEPEGQL